MTDLPTSQDEAVWQPTNDRRIVPIEGITDTIGRLDHRNGLITATTTARYRTERRWIQVWAKSEWRSE